LVLFQVLVEKTDKNGGDGYKFGDMYCVTSFEPLVQVDAFDSDYVDQSKSPPGTWESGDSLGNYIKKSSNLGERNTKKHCCKLCGMQFNYKANFKKHLKIHDDKYYLQCKYCNLSFKQSLTLRNHQADVHGTGKTYTCEDCESSFKSLNNLKSHKEVHHNTGETFSCDFCHMKFKRRYYLKRHISIHTNPDKKFTCDDCGLKCRSKADIAKHVLTHIGVVEKRFFCQICNAGFSKQAHVVRHMRTHSVEKSFPCELCDKAYKDQYTLKTHHETVHLGITFTCEICGFQSDRYSVKKHLKRCVGQKKYICETCHKEYYLKKCYEQHISKCHVVK
jgi:uncharacterized Zn-finger protein